MSEKLQIPKHVAIIMDGNGRWAQNKGLARTEGHREGLNTLRKTIEFASVQGVMFLSVYAFSTENWKRPKKEVKFLMDLFSFFVDKEVQQLQAKKIKIKVLGDRQSLNKKTVEKIQWAEDLTKDNKQMQVNFLFNYGSRQELLQAVNKYLSEDFGVVDEESFSKKLYTCDIPDPDLIIRTGGDYRLSNFLLWQAAYTELYFTPVLWPDFSDKDFVLALEDYSRRQRRFGGVK